jgi:hypothetical protein
MTDTLIGAGLILLGLAFGRRWRREVRRRREGRRPEEAWWV